MKRINSAKKFRVRKSILTLLILKTFLLMSTNANSTTYYDSIGATSITFGQRLHQGHLSSVQISLHEFPNTWKSSALSIKIFNLLMAFNLTFGNIFSLLVFRKIFKNGSINPMNMMIGVDEGLKMVGYTWNIWVVTYSATQLYSNSPSLSTHTGATFCQISYFVGITGVASNIACGLGIALMRLLLIKRPQSIQGHELKTAGCIILACLTITFTAVYLHFVSPKRQSMTGLVTNSILLSFHYRGLV